MFYQSLAGLQSQLSLPSPNCPLCRRCYPVLLPLYGFAAFAQPIKADLAEPVGAKPWRWYWISRTAIKATASLALLAVKVTLQASTVQVQKVQGSSSATSGNRCSIRRPDQNMVISLIVGPEANRDCGTNRPSQLRYVRGREPHHDRFGFQLSVMMGGLPADESVQFGTDAPLQSY